MALVLLGATLDRGMVTVKKADHQSIRGGRRRADRTKAHGRVWGHPCRQSGEYPVQAHRRRDSYDVPGEKLSRHDIRP